MKKLIIAVLKLFYVILFISLPYILFAVAIPLLLSLTPEPIAEALMLPSPESVSSWGSGTMWGLMILYVFLSYLFRNLADDKDLATDKHKYGDADSLFDGMNIYGIIYCLLMPGQLFIISIWPVLKILKLVKSDHYDT